MPDNLSPKFSAQTTARSILPASPSKKMPTTIAEIVALLVVIILGYWFFVMPKSGELGDAQAQLQKQQQTFERVNMDKQTLVQLISKLQQSPQQVALIDEALPLNNRVTRLDVLVEGLAQAAGLKLDTINSQQTGTTLPVAAGNKVTVADPYGPSRKVQTIILDVSLVGTIDQFKNFLQLLETNGRIVDVSTLDISNDQGGTFKLKLQAYSYAP